MSLAERLDWNWQPLEVLRRWPHNTALAALLSGDESSWSRVSVLGVPSEWRALNANEQLTPDDVQNWIRSLDSADGPRNVAADLMNSADGPRNVATDLSDESPIGAGWFVQLSYELGGVLEPSARITHNQSKLKSDSSANAARDCCHHWPLAQAARCEQALVFDHVKNQWWSIGGAAQSIQLREPDEKNSFECAALTQETSDAQYAEAVRTTVALIHAGDLFQTNIARRWHSEVHGSARAFAHQSLARSAARYGALLETPAGMLISMSPELFLELDAQRHVVSRPIKGTRSREVGGEALAQSAKDAAELHMIVDLMRNDLSRACSPGSVRVHQSRALEYHGTVVHGVGEIHGQLQEGCDRATLLAHTFPPGSITGAPKIRAMQVIGHLEKFERGPYCGAIGYLADSGAMKLSVAIRTAVLRERSPNLFALTYAAGCGITSDSQPADEVCETHDKVRVLEQAIQSTSPLAVTNH